MKNESNLATLTRRSFLRNTAALGAAATLYGCSKDDNDNVYYGTDGNGNPTLPDLETTDYFYGTGGHNCGAKCLSKAWVKNGRIIRITSDDNYYVAGEEQNPDSYGNTQSRACTRCRAYKYRLYHPGRLKYPLKQTKARGDLSGFIRMSWEDALEEISRKHKAIIGKYGPESIHSIYACGSYTTMQGGGYYGIWNAQSGGSIPLNYIGGASRYSNDYSYHQQETFGTNYTGYSGSSPSIAQFAGGTVKTVISFGNNTMTTRNSRAHANVMAYKLARENGTKVIYIAPEFVDEGVNVATEWIQIKPYTNAALFAGMLHEMIINTFNSDGSLKNDPWLDVDYLDAAVYGFFDSPEHWLVKTNSGSLLRGTMSMTDPNDPAYTKIGAVAPGRSYSAWIMGNDDRLNRARYDAGKTYIAQQYATVQTYRNAATCSYSVSAGSNTQYIRKQQYLTPKTAEWASEITGIPADRIKELAKMYCTEDAHPIFTAFAAGNDKQLDGVYNRFAMQAFNIITKTYGQTGENISRDGFTKTTSPNSYREEMPNYSLQRATTIPPQNPLTPSISVTQWHNAIKFAFGDVMKDPTKGSRVYNATYIPDWDPTDVGAGKVYHDDGGAKSLVKVQRSATGAPITDADGYYEYETGADGKPVYSGFRFIINSGGNIMMNQHMNPNDTREMLESIPSCGETNDPDNPDDLCIVSFDPFLSPSPRWSDYVLPAATQWEMDQRQSVDSGQNIIIPVVSQPPGEAKSTWNFTIDFLKAYEKVDDSKAGMAIQFVGSDSSGGTPIEGDQYIDKFKRAYTAQNYNRTSRYFGKSFEEALKIQYEPYKPGAFEPSKETPTKNSIRSTIDNYLYDLENGIADSTTLMYPGVSTVSNNSYYGANYANGTTTTFPTAPGRFQVYSEPLIWLYEHRFEKWHKWLKDQGLPTGQKNEDFEGDPIILPIPMYLNYEDSFMEAYGGRDKLPPENNRFLVTTTHSRYRAHSSVAESPLVRELTHRVRNGKEYSCNDWGSYGLSEIDSDGNIPRLNKAIADKDFTRASWHEVLINEEDAERLGISDGEIIQLENPIGAVRVAARLSKRAVKGFIALHQGAWYDPDPEDGVDDGGCANTIMAMKPSRYDHGNGQQSAMVTVKKVMF